MFISFEGIDGAGKSTVLQGLAGFFKDLKNSHNLNVVLTREPGSFLAKNGENPIRTFLLDNKSVISPAVEALLYAADRRMNIENIIKPALKRGDLVVTDRYVDSSLAYQGARDGLSIDKVWELQKWTVDGVMPDLTIFFDASPHEVESRFASRNGLDRIEKSGKEFLNKVYANYQELVRRSPQRFVVIDASQRYEVVLIKTREAIERHLNFCACSPL